MVGDQGIERGDQKQDKGTYFSRPESSCKASRTAGQQTHLKKGIDRYGNHHIACRYVADPVKKAEYQCVYPGMVVGVRDEAKNLLKLVDAVGSHNPRILVEIVRQPAQHTEKKG